MKARSPGRIGPAMGQRPHFIRSGLVPRTIYFPQGFLDRVETRPGALVELLTGLLSDHLQKGGLR